jgi:hypothetical protein
MSPGDTFFVVGLLILISYSTCTIQKDVGEINQNINKLTKVLIDKK